MQPKLHNLTVFVSIAGVAHLWLMLADFDPEGYASLRHSVRANEGVTEESSTAGCQDSIDSAAPRSQSHGRQPRGL